MTQDRCIECQAPATLQVSWVMSQGYQQAPFCKICAGKFWDKLHAPFTSDTFTIKSLDTEPKDSA